MSDDLIVALEATAKRLISLASEDEQFRSALHQLALAVLTATEQPDQVVAEIPVAPGIGLPQPSPEISVNGEQVAALKAAEELPPEATGQFLEKLPELTFGQPEPSAKPVAQSYSRYLTDSSQIALPLVESRCRLKAEGARWAATRHRLISQGATFSSEIAPKDGEIISRAKAISDCFLWMCHPSSPSPTDLSLYENVASCFENVADLVAIIRQIQDKPELLRGELEKCLDLLAEAQSALRVSIDLLGGKPDSDQWLVYQWLKIVGNENQIFLQRFMRLDDPADPAKWTDLATRIDTADARVQDTLKKEKLRTKSLGKVRHKASEIVKSPQDAEANWHGLLPIIDELVSNGLPPSNVELREYLVPVIETLPDIPDLPKNVGLVFREIDRYLATVPPPDIKAPTPPSAEVQEVARLLRGRSMVVIGGERRPESYEALKEALQLQGLIWIETREHESISGFEPYIARLEVAVVALAIRWSSHSHGDVQMFCDKYGKPLVRLPGGYNPKQVAAQILAQCSDRLRREQQ
jgi:hypothetical protein